MHEKICPVCGVKFTTNHKAKVFCSHQCAAGYTYKNGTKCGCFDKDLEWKYSNGTWECPYQKNVSCYTRNCDKCGWNPEVAAARTKAFMEKYNN